MSYITSEAQTLFGLVVCVLGWLVSLLGWRVGLFVGGLVGWWLSCSDVQHQLKLMFFSNKIQVGVSRGISLKKEVLVKVVFLWVICIVHYVDFVALPLHLSRITNRKFQRETVKNPQNTKQQQPPLRPNRQNHESMIPLSLYVAKPSDELYYTPRF